MTLLIQQPPRIDLCEITTDQTGKLRAKITRPWSTYFDAMFARIGGNVASSPDDIEQGQLARVQDYVVSLETSLSMISAESQRVAGEFDALLSQPAPSGLSLSLPAGQVPYGTGLGTSVASSSNFTYDSVTNTLATGNITGSALAMTVQPKAPTVLEDGGLLTLKTPAAAKANTAAGSIEVNGGAGLGAGSGGSVTLKAGASPTGTGGGITAQVGTGTTPGTGTLKDSLGNAVFSWTDTGAVSKLAFFGATRVVQPAAYTLTYSTAVRTVPAATAANVVTTASTLVAYGFTQAQADSIPVAINAMQADMLELKKLIVSLINDLSTTSGVGLNAT